MPATSAPICSRFEGQHLWLNCAAVDGVGQLDQVGGLLLIHGRGIVDVPVVFPIVREAIAVNATPTLFRFALHVLRHTAILLTYDRATGIPA